MKLEGQSGLQPLMCNCITLCIFYEPLIKEECFFFFFGPQVVPQLESIAGDKAWERPLQCPHLYCWLRKILLPLGFPFILFFFLFLSSRYGSAGDFLGKISVRGHLGDWEKGWRWCFITKMHALQRWERPYSLSPSIENVGTLWCNINLLVFLLLDICCE